MFFFLIIIEPILQLSFYFDYNFVYKCSDNNSQLHLDTNFRCQSSFFSHFFHFDYAAQVKTGFRPAFLQSQFIRPRDLFSCHSQVSRVARLSLNIDIVFISNHKIIFCVLRIAHWRFSVKRCCDLCDLVGGCCARNCETYETVGKPSIGWSAPIKAGGILLFPQYLWSLVPRGYILKIVKRNNRRKEISRFLLNNITLADHRCRTLRI